VAELFLLALAAVFIATGLIIAAGADAPRGRK
jgi:hypothetical protein